MTLLNIVKPRKLFICARTFASVMAAGLLICGVAHASVSFLAVGSGAASSKDAVLWTRPQDSSNTSGVNVTAQVSTDETFATGVISITGTTDQTQDYTIHIDATGLRPGTRYFYRFVAGAGPISLVGTFGTAPDPEKHAAVSIGMTGDADGLMRPYPALPTSHEKCIGAVMDGVWGMTTQVGTGQGKSPPFVSSHEGSHEGWGLCAERAVKHNLAKTT